MHQLANLRENGDSEGEITKLNISKPLSRFPAEIFNLANSLEHLDLSGTALSILPDGFGCLKKLKVAFFSNCNFAVFPAQLASCPELEMVAFRGNRMVEVPEDSLPPKLRWLILTDNQIRSLPESIGRCCRLQKCMLAGNQLRRLPDEMVACKKLGLLRLSANCFEELPDWLFDLPELAFLSFAGNPCCSLPATSKDARDTTPIGLLPEISWADLDIRDLLGEGASGTISKGSWNGIDQAEEVAVKLFKGDVTSDGTPADEMEACMRAGSHTNLIDPLGNITDHPSKKGLVMQLIPTCYSTLGLPPSLQSCTRDCFSQEVRLTARQGLRILQGVASAARHLHERGVAHGDLYAHNILYNEDGHAFLGDFGAASIYGNINHRKVERLEVLAFAHLIEDVWSVTRHRFDEEELRVAMLLAALRRRCSDPTGRQRPDFREISRQLSAMER
ncbi:serine/threonine protein kinase [Annulohypoxylon bovei var. microspora]|nr:serine/threonine protein kinase [Annulohypoxylon bovei var. microspora]